MKFALPFMLFAFATAAPTSGIAHTSAESLLSSITSVDLGHDDVILYGVDGISNLISAGVLTYGGNDKVDNRDLLGSSAVIEARDCDGSNAEFEITSKADFLDWDVQISPVIGAQQAPVTIAVARGYSVANSVTVGGTAGISAEGISVGLKIDYQETWTTTDTTTITYTVPTGQYGVIVSQPWTHRIYGNVYTSCTTGGGAKSTFMGSSHTSQTYGSMNWVTGVFRLCASKDYPVPYCNGQGSHH
ncbi:hypothetical protein CI238_02189 [Colletotrichum incanum]|uniref:Uncharacterized protein n=1 Tax=Colletotrichum incanum TaxID=1573173 RepID=A0A162PCL7_COLIC|nr:hypothetical protein CI238_02189 [Colletotrichum incanum]OHW98919.1 hypothetical protein CSPAE12_02308 [Colletotrichum incanum]